jgi:hypothetical protein
MKRLLILLGVLLSGCAATFVVRATAPINDNVGTCAAPLLGPRSGVTVMHFEWTGPISGEDSVSTTAGTQVTFQKNGFPAGLYSIRAWASDLGGAGCDTTISKRFGGPPGKPQGVQ